MIGMANFAETSENDENWYSEFFIPWNMAPMNKQDEEKRTIGVSVSRMIQHLGIGIGFPAASFQRSEFLSVLHKVEVVQANPKASIFSRTQLQTMISLLMNHHLMQVLKSFITQVQAVNSSQQSILILVKLRAIIL